MTRMVRIEERFCGPPGTGNGGYVSGVVARALAGAPAVEVTLRAPTPLSVELDLTQHGDSASLHARDGALLVEARVLAGLELAEQPCVSFDQAERASTRYVGYRDHPYPACFVCGPARPAELGRGLELFPGAVDAEAGSERRLVATPFCPAGALCDEQGQLRTEYVWAALDCPSWFGYGSFVEHAPKTLLGRLAVRIERRPGALERCVVTGFGLGREGRRISCGSALFGADGACIAYGRATWITVE